MQHYNACAYHDEGIHKDALWFHDICPSTDVNYHLEMTSPPPPRVIGVRRALLVPLTTLASQLNL